MADTGHPEIAIQRASSFVEARGDLLARALLAAQLDETKRLALAEAIAAEQRADGAVAAEGAPTIEAVRATARALRFLDLVHLQEHPAGECGVGYLAVTQVADGGWGADLGDEERIALTGEVCGVLARSPFARRSLLESAERWLAGRWTVERLQGGSYVRILAYFHVLVSLPSDLADEALQWCGRELERGFRTGAFGALAVARVFVRCGVRALPGARLTGHEVLAALCAAQKPDGSFPVADTDDADAADAALEGLVAMIGLSP